MENYTKEEIINNFQRDTMIDEGGGELSSELADRKRILGLIQSLDVLGMQNSPDLSFKLNVLDTLWEELEVKADGDVKWEVKEIKESMTIPKKIYSKSIVRGNMPKRKNLNALYNSIQKYNSTLRKESHRQLNLKKGDSNA